MLFIITTTLWLTIAAQSYFGMQSVTMSSGSKVMTLWFCKYFYFIRVLTPSWKSWTLAVKDSCSAKNSGSITWDELFLLPPTHSFPLVSSLEDKRISLGTEDFLCNETASGTGLEKRFFCDANKVFSDENKDDSKEGKFRCYTWDFRISKGEGRCDKEVWFFEGASEVEDNFRDKGTWTWVNWVGDGNSSVSSILGWLERCWGFLCSWFLIIFWLIREDEGEKDDSELDEAEKLSFGLPVGEVLIFS